MAKKPQSKPVFLVLVVVMGLTALLSLQCNTNENEDSYTPCPGNCVEGDMNCSSDMLVLCRDAHWQNWENCASDHAVCVFDGVTAYCDPLPIPDGGWYDTDTGDTDTSAAR
jgi:hypothetical protein